MHNCLKKNNDTYASVRMLQTKNIKQMKYLYKIHLYECQQIGEPNEKLHQKAMKLSKILIHLHLHRCTF